MRGAKILALVVLVGCGGSTAPGSTQANSSGTPVPESGVYQLTQTTQSVRCLPALPTPSTSDATQYVPLPVAGDVAQIRFQVQVSGTQFTVTPLNAQGQAQSGQAFTGTSVAQLVSLTRSFNYGMEGLRQGGHSFFVTESGTITGNFFPDIGTPSGQAVDWQETSQGTDTYTFWDDGFDAQLFGMCVVLYTTSGSRISD